MIIAGAAILDVRRETRMRSFPPVYQRSIEAALICQVLCVLLALMILDTGVFAVQYLVLSLAFWVLAGIFMFVRGDPSMIERMIIAGGPMLIFWFMFFVG